MQRYLILFLIVPCAIVQYCLYFLLCMLPIDATKYERWQAYTKINYTESLVLTLILGAAYAVGIGYMINCLSLRAKASYLSIGLFFSFGILGLYIFYGNKFIV